jgi:hypothetical protein
METGRLRAGGPEAAACLASELRFDYAYQRRKSAGDWQGP